MSKGKSLSEDENRRVREAVKRLLEEHGGNQSRLAPLLGIKQGTLSAFLREKHGAGYGLARRVAELSEVDVQALLGHEPPGRLHESHVEYDERYPNRAKAAAAAKALGYSDEAIEVVRSMALKSDEDLEAEDWLEMMRSEHRRREMFRFPAEVERERAHQEHRAAERAKEVTERGTFEERLAKAKRKRDGEG